MYESICKIITAFQPLTLISGFVLYMLQYKCQYLGFQSRMTSKRGKKYFQISQEFVYVIICL